MKRGTFNARLTSASAANLKYPDGVPPVVGSGENPRGDLPRHNKSLPQFRGVSSEKR